MLSGHDVFNVECQEVSVLFVQAAVFTAAACTLADEAPEPCIHYAPRLLASNWRAFDLRMATKGNIAGVFGFLLRRKPAFAMTSRQVAGARLQLTDCLELKDPPCRFRGKAITERRNEAI